MSIASKIIELTAARDNIRSALVAKGVSAETHGFNGFASDIAAIPNGGSMVENLVSGSLDISSATRSITIEGIEGFNNLLMYSASSPTQSGKSIVHALLLAEDGKFFHYHENLFGVQKEVQKKGEIWGWGVVKNGCNLRSVGSVVELHWLGTYHYIAW